MHTMITIGDHTFPFELSHFHRYTSTSDEEESRTTYYITIPDLREGNNEGFGSQSYQFWTDKAEEVAAIDYFLKRKSINLVDYHTTLGK